MKTHRSDGIKVLLEFYDEAMRQSRTHGTIVSTITNMVLSITAALLAFVAYDGLQPNDLPITIIVVFLGVYGAFFCFKHLEQNRYHATLATEYREALQIFPELRLKELYELANDEHKKQFPCVSRWKPKLFWMGFHFLIAFMGAILTAIIVFSTHR